MKKFIEEYGFAILAAIVVILLIALATPVGSLIRESVSSVVDSMAVRVEERLSNVEDSNVKVFFNIESLPYGFIISESSTDVYDIDLCIKGNNGEVCSPIGYSEYSYRDGRHKIYFDSTPAINNKDKIRLKATDVGTGKEYYSQYVVYELSKIGEDDPWNAVNTPSEVFDMGDPFEGRACLKSPSDFKNDTFYDLDTFEGTVHYYFKEVNGDKATVVSYSYKKSEENIIQASEEFEQDLSLASVTASCYFASPDQSERFVHKRVDPYNEVIYKEDDRIILFNDTTKCIEEYPLRDDMLVLGDVDPSWVDYYSYNDIFQKAFGRIANSYADGKIVTVEWSGLSTTRYTLNSDFQIQVLPKRPSGCKSDYPYCFG